MRKPGRFHWLRHLIGWAPCEVVASNRFAVLVRCVMCGRETWLE